MNPYPWLTIGEDGSIGADLQGCTAAEMDRRLVIMQEIEAGRVVVAARGREWWLCPECCSVWTTDQTAEFAGGHYDPYDYNLPSCWGVPIRVRGVLTPPAPSRSPRSASPPPR